MTIALMAIAILSFFVWAHHMFVAGISVYSGLVFSLLTFLVAVPSAIKVFNWAVSLHNGRISSAHRCSMRSDSSCCSR
jgi:cytochrome c oxidase subunit 1